MDAPHNWKKHLTNQCSHPGCPLTARYSVGYRGLGYPQKTSQGLCEEHIGDINQDTHFLILGTLPVTHYLTNED